MTCPSLATAAKTVNKLRLWSAEPYTEDFDLDAFNAGDYARANKFRSDVEAISTILYPNDAGEHGRMLRLKQEYLFVSAGLQTILRTYEREFGPDWENLGKHVSIHTNDTHPAMCGPELLRMLVDDKGMDFSAAYQVCLETISFTNHTVMPEALEKWPINTFRTLLPRLYMIIEEVDRRYRDSLSVKLSPNDGKWTDVLRNTAILWDGQVRMGQPVHHLQPLGQRRLRAAHPDSQGHRVPRVLRDGPAALQQQDQRRLPAPLPLRGQPLLLQAHQQCHRRRLAR